MLSFLLLCLLSEARGTGCLRCWPELPALLDYDLQILWGTPGPPTELSQNLHTLFLENNTWFKPLYLDRDHLDLETAIFFTHLDQTIKRLRDDKSALLEEVRAYEGLLAKSLNKRLEELKNMACNDSCEISSTIEITECDRCQTHILSCHDSVLCPGRNFSYKKFIILVTVVMLLLTTAGIGCYCIWQKKKKKAENKGKSGRAPPRTKHQPR